MNNDLFGTVSLVLPTTSTDRYLNVLVQLVILGYKICLLPVMDSANELDRLLTTS